MAPHPSRSGSILVVDDDVLVRAVLRDALAPRAVCVLGAGAAAELARTRSVEVLVVGLGGDVDVALASLLLERARAWREAALRVLLSDRFDARGGALHPLAHAVWSRTTLDARLLARWIDENRSRRNPAARAADRPTRAFGRAR